MRPRRGLIAALTLAGLAVTVASPASAAGDVLMSAIAFSLERNVTGVSVLVPGPTVSAAIQNAYTQAIATCRANGGGLDCGPVAYAAQGDCAVLLYDPGPKPARPRGVYEGESGKTVEEAVHNASRLADWINPTIPPREQICT
jgi:hypothetical protein